MPIIVLVLLVAGFAAGVYLAHRCAPPLADTREGRLVAWVVAILVGASACLLVDALWVAVRALTISSGSLPGFFGSDEEVVIGTAREVFFTAVLPLGLAGILHQLGPGPDRATEDVAQH